MSHTPSSTTLAPTPATALAWVTAPPPALPDLVLARQIGPIGWQVLIRDGVLVHVWGEVAIRADRIETADVRALAAEPMVPGRGVIGRGAAVWVHAGGPRPDRIDVLIAPRARRPDPHFLRASHECELPAGDVVQVGRLRVTTLERTAVDVARWSPPHEAAAMLERLVAVCGLDLDRCLRVLSRVVGYRGHGHAHAVLAAFGGAAGLTGPATLRRPSLSPASPHPLRAQRRPGSR